MQKLTKTIKEKEDEISKMAAQMEKNQHAHSIVETHYLNLRQKQDSDKKKHQEAIADKDEKIKELTANIAKIQKDYENQKLSHEDDVPFFQVSLNQNLLSTYIFVKL